MNEQTHIIIPSCDAYSDAWSPFFQLLFRYWPGCPYPIHLVSTNETYEDPRVHNISLTEDLGWASNLRRVIEDLGCKSIVYMQEDYFLQSPMNTTRLESVIQYGRQIGAGYIRLAGAPNPDLPHDNPFGLGEISRGADYRCSLQAAWWNAETLLKLLVDGETGWDMELRGSGRSSAMSEPFLATYVGSPLIDYYADTGILKGKWLPGALRFCRREGIDVDTSRRGTHAELPLLMKRLRKSPPITAARSLFKRRRPAA
ncbi:MAG: hypothetical protein KDA93_22525 [Planctomycetaceae bacterium]|nr:hypothetical protein [Planctomycetaceae bacterium]